MNQGLSIISLLIAMLFLVACTKGTPEISSLSSLKSGIEIESSELRGEKLCLASGVSKKIKLKCHDLRVVKVEYAVSSQDPASWQTLTLDGSNVTCASGDVELSLPAMLSSANHFLYLRGQTENAEVPQVRYAIVDPSVNPLQLLNSSLSMAASSQLQLQVAGGVEPYIFKILSGDGSIEQNGLFTAGNVSGHQAVKVEISDSQCAAPIVGDLQVIGEFGVVLANVPPNLNRLSSLDIDVELVREQLQPVAGNYKYSLTRQADCTASDYASAVVKDSGLNITDSLSQDGEYFLCVWGQKANQTWQSFEEALKAKWTRDTTPPNVSINALGSNYINQGNQASLTLAGSCSENNQKLTISFNSNGEDLLCAEGAWSLVKDFSSYADGTVTVSVSQVDTSTNVGTSSSMTLTKDTISPAAPSGVADGVYGNSLISSPSIQFTSAVESGNSVNVELQVIENSTQAVIKAWTSATAGASLSGLSLQEAKTYKVQLRSVDLAGNYSNTVTSDGWLVDTQGPTLGSSFVDGDNAFSLSESPTMTWTAATDSGSGLAQYEIAIGSAAGSNDIMNFTSVAKVLTGKLTGLNLNKNATYYSTIRAKDNAGNYSSTKNGDGWLVIGDPCEGIAEGGTCWGGGIYVGTLDGKKYMTTPGGCTDSSSPICNGGIDTVKRVFAEYLPTDTIPEVETVTDNTQKSSLTYGGAYYQYWGNPSKYLSYYSGTKFGGYQLASGWCYTMNYGGFDDWFLPNKTEAAFLYCKAVVGSHSSSYPQESPNCTEYGGKKSLVGGFANNNYWVATFATIASAKAQSFINGNQTSISKTNSTFIRCMRSY